MPELPEVQAHAERLSTAFAGTDLQSFEPLSFAALKTATPSPSDAEGRTLDRVGRRGKYLLAQFAELTFVVHLMQGGRLRTGDGSRAPAKRPRGALARWVFADGRTWLLTEAGTEHRAGVWVVAGDPLSQAPLDHLGPEADTATPDELARGFAEHNMRLHGWLRDQRLVAGLGRRLANEVCWRAELSPFAMTARLGPDGARRVVDAIAAAVAEGLEAERARDDMSASAERPGAVHGRTGEECLRCGDRLRAVEYQAYTVTYCPTCQTGGKVLADNTTSRFVK